MKNVEAVWTLDELTTEVEEALAEGYGGAASGRVRDIPDRRTIRYYTTLGLIDRPAAMRGRTALYGRRHLLQLVAIKKLQAGGRSLAEIQAALTGQPDAELTRIAGQGGAVPTSPAVPEPAPARRDFWRDEPAAHALAAPSEEEGASPARHAAADRPQALFGVPLHPDVTLLLAASRPVDVEELAAIRVAAAPLIDMLTRTRLIEPPEGGDHP